MESQSGTRFNGGGFGLKGAVKGMIIAGALNMVSDIGQGLRNSSKYSDYEEDVDLWEKKNWRS